MESLLRSAGRFKFTLSTILKNFSFFFTLLFWWCFVSFRFDFFFHVYAVDNFDSLVCSNGGGKSQLESRNTAGTWAMNQVEHIQRLQTVRLFSISFFLSFSSLAAAQWRTRIRCFLFSFLRHGAFCCCCLFYTCIYAHFTFWVFLDNFRLFEFSR